MKQTHQNAKENERKAERHRAASFVSSHQLETARWVLQGTQGLAVKGLTGPAREVHFYSIVSESDLFIQGLTCCQAGDPS